jgi:hypothetical protein
MVVLRVCAGALAACSLAVGGSPALSQSELTAVRAPDHVLVWSQEAGRAEEVFRSLGFTVHDGQDFPEGISTSTVVFADWSFLELLHFSDPAKATGNAQAEQERAFVASGPGANSFAIEVADLDAAAAALRQAGLELAASPDLVDPDGPDGPRPPEPASWRDFHFVTSPVAGVEMFFIDYPPEPEPSPEGAERFRARSTHANAARRLSAVWVRVPDLEAEAEAYRRIGFSVSGRTPAPALGGSARVASLTSGAVVLVETAEVPAAFRVAERDHAHVIGLSFEVADLAVTRKAATPALSALDGPLGPSLVAPMARELGLFLAFHEPAAAR